MAKNTLPPRFKAWAAPKFKAIEAKTNTGRHRISPRKRGYDARWDRLARSHKRVFPFCRFCEQEDRDGLAEVTDHILPAHEYPHLRYDWENLQSLCAFHHDNLKQKLENIARKLGNLELLVQWSADPLTRPVSLRPFPK